jgi:hypothetical protein
VDLEGRRLQVAHALVRPAHGTEWLLETPKTGNVRDVSLFTGTVPALGKHRDRQAVERLIAGESEALHDFATPRGEPLNGTLVCKYHWRPTLNWKRGWRTGKHRDNTCPTRSPHAVSF